MKKVISIIISVLLVSAVFTFAGCTQKDVGYKTGTYTKAITDNSVEGIKAHGTLVVATNPEFPPFESMEGANAVGWDIDLAYAIAKELGVELFVNTMDFTSVLASPNAKKCHIAMAGITANEERSKTLTFTNTVFNSSQVIIVKSDNTTINGPMDLEGKHVGAQKGTVGELLGNLDPDWAFDEGNPILGRPSNCSPYNSGAMAVQALINGQIDAVIIDQFPAEKFVEANTGKIKIVANADGLYNSVFDDEYAFAVEKGNDNLVNYLNELLDKFKTDGTLDEINKKWFGQ